MEQKSPFESFDTLQISTQAKSFLRETGKWANFLSILGFIGTGFIVLLAMGMFAFGSNSMFGNRIGGGFLGFGVAIVYLLMGLLYFIPLYYLNKFANFVKDAINRNDNQKMTEAFGYLKSHYKFIGIFTIIILGVYIFIFLFAMLGAGFSAFS